MAAFAGPSLTVFAAANKLRFLRRRSPAQNFPDRDVVFGLVVAVLQSLRNDKIKRSAGVIVVFRN